MKWKINKNIRKGCILGVIAVMAVSGALMYKAWSSPEIREEKMPVYTYTNTTGIRHNVLLKSNPLYGDDKSLGPGNTYITEFVDAIQASFQYEFMGQRLAEVQGHYLIKAVAEGYTSEKDATKSLWKKEFILVPKTEFTEKDTKITVKNDVTIKMSEYNDFTRSVLEASKISSQVRLTISMDINVDAVTDAGKVAYTLSPGLVVPLSTNYFEITAINTGKKEGAIEETRTITLPADQRRLILYGVIQGILLLMLTGLLFLTRGAAVNAGQKALKTIFKQHGDRMVALHSHTGAEATQTIIVRSMKDLVRVSDEIGKPILYQYSTELADITEFFVWDHLQIYVFNLGISCLEEDTEELECHRGRGNSKEYLNLPGKTASGHST